MVRLTTYDRPRDVIDTAFDVLFPRQILITVYKSKNVKKGWKFKYKPLTLKMSFFPYKCYNRVQKSKKAKKREKLAYKLYTFLSFIYCLVCLSLWFGGPLLSPFCALCRRAILFAPLYIFCDILWTYSDHEISSGLLSKSIIFIQNQY